MVIGKLAGTSAGVSAGLSVPGPADPSRIRRKINRHHSTRLSLNCSSGFITFPGPSILCHFSFRNILFESLVQQKRQGILSGDVSISLGQKTKL